ncbi:MAG: hypothetical protein HYU68_15070 [Bacteroidetes bacterium]|nr:hypothetical protein [Bacteroidota bacterium]
MRYFILILFFAVQNFTYAQIGRKANELKDSTFTIPMITANYGMAWKAGDISNRFGRNNAVGGSFVIKNKKNWYYGVKGNFNWGNDVKESSILDGIKTSEGMVIDNEGRLTFIYLEERGSSFFLTGGKVFNVLANNKNSGILVYGGLGTLHHKIKISFKDNITSLSDEYKKGYDRLSFGYAANVFIGYMHLSKNRFINFFGGFDFIYGQTQSLRKFNYDTQQADTEYSSNILYGFNVGWIIRLNKRTKDEFYYD